MLKNERGQLLIITLIILAIGSALVMPILRFNQTALGLSSTVTSQNRGLFAVDSAQTIVMWKLLRGGLTDDFTDDGDRVEFTVTTCDIVVNVAVTMRALEQGGGVILATDYTMLPTKTVSPSFMGLQTTDTLTYTIEIKQVRSNTTANLEFVYDILPKSLFAGNSLADFYELGSSEISTDGTNWTSIPDPSYETFGGQQRLRWPASGNFTDAAFKEIAVTDSHYLRFNGLANSPNQDGVHCNWAVIQAGEVPTPSGPRAAVLVGDPNLDPDLCSEAGVYNVWKTSDPQIIPPLVETIVTYTIYITNMSGSSQRFGYVSDILPPGFSYVAEDAYIIDGNGDNFTILRAYSENNTYNGIERQRAWWTSGNDPGDQLTAGGWNMAAGENITLTFHALATQGVSGSYFNEVFVFDQGGVPLPGVFDGTGVEGAFSTYSWNSGTVIVPAYDSETTGGGENITANFGLDINGITVNSWQIR